MTLGTLTDPKQLDAILQRAVTMAQATVSPTRSDDLRMLRNIRPRFIGRSAYRWLYEESDTDHFAAAERFAAQVHDEVDTDIVLQCCLFEAVYPEIDEIAIPGWVFTSLGEQIEKRNFSWQAMIGAVEPPGQGTGTTWFGGGVLDVTMPETRRWYYYLAVRYLQAGYEAIHLGQAHLIAGADPGYRAFAELCDLIRQAAAEFARRGWVILDAHSHGMVVDGRLLFDFCSMPMTSRSVRERYPVVALVHRGSTRGGRHPGGWQCATSPCLFEQDNWLGYSLAPDSPAWQDAAARAAAGKWGWDDITWYAHLSPPERAEWHHYARAWSASKGSNCYYQPAINRSLGEAAITRHDGAVVRRYQANYPSDAAPLGFGDEDLVRQVLDQVAPLPADAEPMPTGSPDLSWLMAGPAVVQGPLKTLLGGVPGEASCPWSALHHCDEHGFHRTFVAPVAGRSSFHLTCGGTGTHQIRADGTASGPEFVLTLLPRHAIPHQP